MREKDREQAACIEAFSQHEHNLDETISDLKLEIQTCRTELCKQSRDHKRYEKFATKKLDNFETIMKNEKSESTERHERLSERIGKVERKHENLENKISSTQNQIIDFLKQNQKDMGYMKERVKHIPTQLPEDEDLNLDENLKRKTNLNTGSKPEPKRFFNNNF